MKNFSARLSRRGLLLAASLGLAFLGLLGGCAATQAEPSWVEREIAAANDQLLIDCTALAIQKTGFPVGGGIDPGRLVAVSGWHISLAPFRGKGWREQCEVHYARVGPGKYKASVRVRHDKNDDIIHPLDLTYAKWLPEPDNTDRARMVLQHVQSLLGPGVEVAPSR